MEGRATARAAKAAIGVALAVILGSCGAQSTSSCDTAQYFSCVDGVVYLQGCVERSVAAHCVQGCADPGKYKGYYGCPFSLCRENQPKSTGDACTTAAASQPTVATASDRKSTSL